MCFGTITTVLFGSLSLKREILHSFVLPDISFFLQGKGCCLFSPISMTPITCVEALQNFIPILDLLDLFLFIVFQI